jgi:hypothetical protein
MNLKEKYAGKSFAEIAETISKKYKNREIDPVQKRSFETEINALKDLQETYRLKESIKDKMAGGGMLSSAALGAGKGIAEAFAGALTVPMKAVGGNIEDNELYALTLNPIQSDIYNYQRQQQKGQFGALPTFAAPLTSTAKRGTPEVTPEQLSTNQMLDKMYQTDDTGINITSSTAGTNLDDSNMTGYMTPVNTGDTTVDELPRIKSRAVADKDKIGISNPNFVAPKQEYDEEFAKMEEAAQTVPSGTIASLNEALPTTLKSNPIARGLDFKVDEALAKIKSFKGDTEIGEFLRSAYGPMGVGKGIEMLGKGAMLLGGYDRFSPNYNPYEQQALNLMRSQGIDTQAVENKILAQEEEAIGATGNVRSTAVQQALQQGINVNTADALANAELQQQQMRNQLSSQMAGALNVAGQQRVQAEDTARALTAASKASYQQNVVNLLETIGATGEEISNFKTGQISDALSLNIMAKMYDFGYDVECVMKNLSTGNINGCFKANDNKSENAVPKPDLTVKGK